MPNEATMHMRLNINGPLDEYVSYKHPVSVYQYIRVL